MWAFVRLLYMGSCQNYGPFLGTQVPYYKKDPKRDPNFDNHPYVSESFQAMGAGLLNVGA